MVTNPRTRVSPGPVKGKSEAKDHVVCWHSGGFIGFNTLARTAGGELGREPRMGTRHPRIWGGYRLFEILSSISQFPQTKFGFGTTYILLKMTPRLREMAHPRASQAVGF